MTGFRGRMVALAALIAALAVAILVVVSAVVVDRVTDADALALARTRAQAVTASVAVQGGRVVLTENGNEVLDAVAWLYADGSLIDGQVPADLVAPVHDLASVTHAVSTTVAGNLLYAEPLAIQGHHVVAVVRVDLAPYVTSERHALVMSAVLGALTIVLAGGVAFVVVGRAMRVVHRMAAMAEDWGEHEPGRRFGVGQPNDEFGELAGTLDHLLDRVEHALLDERRLTDEIAHELRTPMTALRGEAQLAQLADAEVDPAVVLHEIDRLDTAVTTLLNVARQRMDGTAHCDLRAALTHTIAGRAIDLACPSIAVAASNEVVTSIASPLLDNALQHARSSVRVQVRVEPGRAVVDVIDDGAGFSTDEVGRVFEPGVTGGTGHGLGLALVRRIASAAGVDVRAIADGRGVVRVTFPTPHSASQSG